MSNPNERDESTEHKSEQNESDLGANETSNVNEKHLLSGPVQGRTYSLYGTASYTAEYYQIIDELAQECLKRWPDIPALLADLRSASTKRRRLRRLLRTNPDESPVAFILTNAAQRLSVYTSNTATHLRELSLYRRRDRILATTREQYHLYMLEVELLNRHFLAEFKRCGTKLAFLPYCLRDLRKECCAAPHGHDTICMACSRRCYINAVSRLLRKHNVEPYIWMSAKLKQLLQDLKARPGGVGVLGIACFPELISGMRTCVDIGVPVVGLPLDANRCARWMGEFYENTFSLWRLEALLAE